jgi:hypothetical protein
MEINSMLNFTDEEINELWEAGNNAGNGYPVGEPGMTPWEAAEAEGMEDIRTFDTPTTERTEVVAHDVYKWVAICDANGPWAVDILTDS